MKKLLGMLALCGVVAMPAMAQVTPAQTNLDESAAKMEVRNARGKQLTAVSPEQAHANELKRCENLPDFYKSDCVARVNDKAGEVTGSVIGGGMFKETITTMPKPKLEAELNALPDVWVPTK